MTILKKIQIIICLGCSCSLLMDYWLHDGRHAIPLLAVYSLASLLSYPMHSWLKLRERIVIFTTVTLETALMILFLLLG